MTKAFVYYYYIFKRAKKRKSKKANYDSIIIHYTKPYILVNYEDSVIVFKTKINNGYIEFLCTEAFTKRDNKHILSFYLYKATRIARQYGVKSLKITKQISDMYYDDLILGFKPPLIFEEISEESNNILNERIQKAVKSPTHFAHFLWKFVNTLKLTEDSFKKGSIKYYLELKVF